MDDHDVFSIIILLIVAIAAIWIGLSLMLSGVDMTPGRPLTTDDAWWIILLSS